MIIAPEADPHALVVARRIELLGGNATILDSAKFPTECELSVETSSPQSWRYRLRYRGIELDDTQVAGIWWRRPRRHQPAAEIVEGHLRRFAAEESREAFDGWLHCLGDRVINPVAGDVTASHKLLQLRAATRVGLTVPHTLATNSPADARTFCERIGSGTVFKAFTGADWQFITTRRIARDSLAHVDAVAYAPVIFQEEIGKRADIRATVIDETVFAVAITARGPRAPIDWRADPARTYEPHALPEHVSNKLVALLSALGLRFAACDLALLDSGDYVFFEANPGGQWLFAEIAAGLEISVAIARALLGGPPARHSARGPHHSW